MIGNYKIIIAKHWWQKLRGLYFRPKNTLLFIFGCNDIHTMFMRKNIDVAFIDEDGETGDVYTNLKPWSRVHDPDACITIERFANDDPWLFPGQFIINKGGEHEGVSSM